MKPENLIVGVIVLAVVVLLIRGCGEPEEPEATDPTSETTTEAPAPTETTTAEPAADDDDSATAAVEPTPEPTPERELGARRLDASSLPHGPAALGQTGDIALSSARGVRFIVADLPHRIGVAETGGNLIDIEVDGGDDVFDGMLTFLDKDFPRQGAYRELQVDSTSVTATGFDSGNGEVSVATTWRLLPEGDAGVLGRLEVSTTVTNLGEAPIAEYELGDIIGWGGLTAFAPGLGANLAGKDEKLAWVGGSSEDHALLVVASGPLTGPHGSAWSDPVWGTRTLDPQVPETYVRQLLVGRSLTDLAGAAAEVQGLETADVLIEVRHGSTTGIAGATATLMTADEGGGYSPYVFGVSDAKGELRTKVPPGRYRVIGHSPARHLVTYSEGVVSTERSKPFRILLSGRGGIKIRAVDTEGNDIPARFQFEGIGDAADADFGPETRAIGGNRAHILGPTALPLPPGGYRVTASHGPTWTIDSRNIRIDETAQADGSGWLELVATLKKVVPTDGWLQCDLHQHSAYSYDAAVLPADGLIASVAEGLDCVATTDHDAVADWTDHLAASGVADSLTLLTGVEVSSEVQGHFNVFPWDPARTVLDHRGKTAAGIVEGLRSAAPEAVVQVNHPTWGRIGMFNAVGMDPRTGALIERDEAGAPTGATYDFDAIEILNGTDVEKSMETLGVWLRMVDSGRVATIVGNSDSHGLVRGPRGSSRTWIPDTGTSATDSVVTALRQTRKASASTGPFIDIERNGSSSDNEVPIRVVVRTPEWMPLDKVELIGGDPVGRGSWALGEWGSGTPGLTETIADGLRTWVLEFRVPVAAADGWVIAVASSEASMEPWSEARAYAVTNPLRIGR